MKIISTIKNYEVHFGESLPLDEDYFIIDKNVYNLHRKKLSSINKNRIYLVDADEKEKSFRRCADHIESLISLGLRRGHTVAAIGGGIIQDLSGFVASIIYRGVDWNFYPTTLLSQCDSCIGGKTSINLSGSKNTVGNFNPPNKVILNKKFLDTLATQEIQSGLGEILKVMVIDKKDRIKTNEFLLCVENSRIKTGVLKAALKIKKEIIEKDEFDKGERNVMNYGHTFGHAIESITSFNVPHGISVGIGIKIANSISEHLNLVDKEKIKEINNSVNFFVENNQHHVDYFLKSFDTTRYLKCLSKDKKNTDNDNLTCILLDSNGSPFKTKISNVRLNGILEKNIKSWLGNKNEDT